MSSSLITQSSLDMRVEDKLCAKRTVSSELGSKIMKLCHKYRNERIELESLEYYFHREFLYPLDLKTEGFESIHALIECLIQNSYPIQLLSNEANGVTRVQSDLKTYHYWVSVIKVNEDFHLMDILSDITDDVIPCGQRLPEFQFPPEVEFNGLPEILSGNILSELIYSEVRLMVAKSPHEMYLQLCGEDYHNAYHRLRTGMRFYDKRENAEKYRIPSLLLYPGLLCAVKYPKVCDEWHRSTLVSIDRQNNCKLLLVDIGEVIETNAKEMRLLLKKFSSLPAQALKVQLTGIRPNGQSGQHWSNWAKNLVKPLEDLNYSGKIECAFVDYQCDRYRVYIRYYDRFKSNNANDLLFLHQILVDKRLALISSFDQPID